MAQERYGLIGTGSRAGMYVRALSGTQLGAEHVPEIAELVAWSDVNPGRLDVHEREVVAAGRPAPARYAPDDLERMIRDERIDRVIVTTPDFTHADFVVRALHAGADVVVEKPLTIDAESVRRIGAAIAETGREVITTFNYRYSPRNSTLRRVIADGEIGAVTSVHFEWALDTVHGADYFRRWHRLKANSVACSSTRRRTTSTSSTGGSPRRPCACSRAAGCASTVPRTPPPAASASVRRAAPGRPAIRSRSTSPATRTSRSSTSTRSTTTATCATETCSTRASRSRTTSPRSSTTTRARP
jgi:hypothetical protein